MPLKKEEEEEEEEEEKKKKKKKKKRTRHCRVINTFALSSGYRITGSHLSPEVGHWTEVFSWSSRSLQGNTGITN